MVAAPDDHRAGAGRCCQYWWTIFAGAGVDRLRAAGAEEDGGIRQGRERGEAPRELQCGRVRVVAEDVVRGERPELGGDRVRDLAAAVADVREPEPRGRVEVLGAVRVPDARALAAREHELVPVDLAHRGERMPEPGGRRHRAMLTRRGRLAALRSIVS